MWPADQSGIGWTITDIQCHFFNRLTLSGSILGTITLLASYDPHPRIFCPWGEWWGKEMDNFEACSGDCFQRHPTAAGRNIRWAVVYCTSLSSISPSMPRPLYQRIVIRTTEHWDKIRILFHLTYSPQDAFDHQQSLNSMNQDTTYLLFFILFSFLSGLSLALNKEGCDWQDRHSARANSGRATHLSQTRYTPLVEVNQAIKAWSF